MMDERYNKFKLLRDIVLSALIVIGLRMQENTIHVHVILKKTDSLFRHMRRNKTASPNIKLHASGGVNVYSISSEICRHFDSLINVSYFVCVL